MGVKSFSSYDHMMLRPFNAVNATIKYYEAYTSIRSKKMVLRCLTTEEIDTLTAKKGVRAIAVHNFCSSMGGQTSM